MTITDLPPQLNSYDFGVDTARSDAVRRRHFEHRAVTAGESGYSTRFDERVPARTEEAAAVTNRMLSGRRCPPPLPVRVSEKLR